MSVLRLHNVSEILFLEHHLCQEAFPIFHKFIDILVRFGIWDCHQVCKLLSSAIVVPVQSPHIDDPNLEWKKQTIYHIYTQPVYIQSLSQPDTPKGLIDF